MAIPGLRSSAAVELGGFFRDSHAARRRELRRQRNSQQHSKQEHHIATATQELYVKSCMTNRPAALR